jgi:hypothetical protein
LAAADRSRAHAPETIRPARQSKPAFEWTASEAGADDQNRTGDLVLTKDALCQLSYIGLRAFGASADKSAAFRSRASAGTPAAF